MLNHINYSLRLLFKYEKVHILEQYRQNCSLFQINK
jgi:hypothetical protein